MYGQVHYFAILVAAIIAMIIGFAWFSPALFGTLWMRIIGADKLTRKEPDRMQQEVKPLLAVMFKSMGGGLQVAFWVWIGFAVPYALGEAIFGGKDKACSGPCSSSRRAAVSSPCSRWGLSSVGGRRELFAQLDLYLQPGVQSK